MEFRVWTELIQQSHGALHVFLPLLDRGLDAVVHRLTDGEYIPLQVKGKSQAVNGFVEIVVPATELVDDRALIVAGLLTAEGLGSKLLVVEEETFKRRAAHSEVQGVEVYAASFSTEYPRHRESSPCAGGALRAFSRHEPGPLGRGT